MNVKDTNGVDQTEPSMMSPNEQDLNVAFDIRESVPQTSNYVTINKLLPMSGPHRRRFHAVPLKSLPSEKFGDGEILRCRSPRSLIHFSKSLTQFAPPTEQNHCEGDYFAHPQDKIYDDINDILPIVSQTIGMRKVWIESSKEQLSRTRVQQRRAYRRVAAAASHRSAELTGTMPNRAVLQQKEKRMKNRASVEKCREKKRARLENLERERLELCLENEKLKKVLGTYGTSLDDKCDCEKLLVQS